ncbi:DUF1214 domain-containing protein [Vibrio sp. ZSDE26]|uniref:DUF1214 domain-containing protein n=1 Tax=Vibrio amylolyticus TaxID=2847292 RepID=A0A9X1XF85_9VIBR|nr:DUF1214 domain-containing protein [Vibrio amylolyticus]MCK6261912.1 DUF1214 domain-containing protein [Vibrio amylolyticus]
MKKTILATLLSLTSITSFAGEPAEVTEQNYSTAMFDMAMNVEASNGGLQDWNHHRAPMKLDEQPAPMMNRDTLYSFVVADARSDIKVTLPELDGRYLSVHVMNHNHDTAYVFYGAGDHIIKADDTTDYIAFYARTQVNAASPEDVKKVNEYQDAFKFEYVDSTYEPQAFEATKWDMATFMPIHQKWIEIAQSQGIADAISDLEAGVIVSQDDRNRGVAISTGLLPDAHASYKVAEYHLDKNTCYVATYDAPEMTDEELGFYSITMYDDKQYLATDEYSIITNQDIAFNQDGTFTVHYGNAETASCGEVDNLLHVPTDAISINMRIYLPNMDKIDAYTLPELQAL